MHGAKVALLLPGEMVKSVFLADQLKDCQYVIAVDAGIIQAHHLDVIPDLWVGDFDSTHALNLPSEVLEQFSQIPKQTYPQEKDFLDTELALEFAASLNASSVLLIGGMAGRPDHLLALQMMPLKWTQFNFTYTNGQNVWYSLSATMQRTPQTFSFALSESHWISLVPLQNCLGVSMSGTRWPLKRASLYLGSGLSVSNENIASEVNIAIEFGVLWVMIQKKE